MIEALALSLLGGLLGAALAWWFFNGHTVATLGGAFAQTVIAASDRDLRALVQETPGYRQTQASGTAGDQRALPLQQAHGRSV